MLTQTNESKYFTLNIIKVLESFIKLDNTFQKLF